MCWHAVQTHEAAPVNTEAQMKEAAAALKEENDELAGKAASTSTPDPAAEAAEMVNARTWLACLLCVSLELY